VKLVYLAGAPASGKSSLMAELTKGCVRESVYPSKVPHDKLYVNKELVGAEMGRIRDKFPGTDTLAYNIVAPAKVWLREVFYDFILGEGDRLAKIAFLDEAQAAGYQVHLAVLSAPMTVLNERCERRGSTQNLSWRIGRATAATRLGAFAEAADMHVHYLDSTKPTLELATTLRDRIAGLSKLGGVEGHVHSTTTV
jgi:P-loop Nucleotide Kinase3